MASTASSLLLLELMADGENENTWGQKTNTNIALIENAIAKRQEIVLGSTDLTLSDTQFADSQARSLCIAASGTLSANVNVIVPSRSKMYLFTNECTGAFTVTVKTSAGTGVICPQGTTVAVFCDGTNVIGVSASVSGSVAEATNAINLGGVAAANYARRDEFNQHTQGFATTFVPLTDGGTVTLNATLGNAFSVVLGGNRTLSITNPHDGQAIELWVIQDGAGSRSLAWPSNVLFEGGQTPSLSPAANAINRFFLTYNAALTTWIATRGEVAGSNTTTVTLSVSGNSQDIDLYALAGQPGGAVTVNITVETGVLITGSSPTTPAVDTRGFAAGSIINLTNFGYILGMGGDGGRGSQVFRAGGEEDFFVYPRAGQAGGTAILGPGASRTLNIFNASGFIWGGGGGGGGGGGTANNGQNASGGGGGGGAGGGSRGEALGMANGAGGAPSTIANGSDGVAGSTGRLGSFGAGGAGAGSSGGAGGAGGDWGSAGASGASPSGSDSTIAGGTGGTAGKAVDPNGGTANVVSGSGSPHIKGTIS